MFYKAHEVNLTDDESYCIDSSGLPVTGTVLFDESDENIAEINYVNGQRHGLTKIRALDDSYAVESNYANGVEHGEQRYYDDARLCIVSHFKNGIKDGNVTHYYPNGNIFHKYSLNNDLLDGSEIYYYESGIIASECSYRNGEAISEQKHYHRNGNLRRVYPMKDGLIQYFYPNGNIYKEIPTADNKRHGEARWYAENGILIATQDYQQGIEQGNGKRYTPQGDVEFEIPYSKSSRLFYKIFEHCIMLYQLSALTNELLAPPLISFISLPDQSNQQSRLEGYLTNTPDYFQYSLTEIMFAPHINLSAWKTKSSLTVQFDNDLPQSLRCKFYNRQTAQYLCCFPNKVYQKNDILPSNDLEALGLYVFVNEYNQIGGIDYFFEHKKEVTIQVGRKGSIKFDLSALDKCKEFYINNLEFLYH